jgi:hypothetical protein
VCKLYPYESRDDLVRVARNRGPDIDLEQIAKDFGIRREYRFHGRRVHIGRSGALTILSCT